MSDKKKHVDVIFLNIFGTTIVPWENEFNEIGETCLVRRKKQFKSKLDIWLCANIFIGCDELES